MKYKVVRVINDSYGGEEIEVEAESKLDVQVKVRNTPITAEALAELYWDIESIEEVK